MLAMFENGTVTAPVSPRGSIPVFFFPFTDKFPNKQADYAKYIHIQKLRDANDLVQFNMLKDLPERNLC